METWRENENDGILPNGSMYATAYKCTIRESTFCFENVWRNRKYLAQICASTANAMQRTNGRMERLNAWMNEWMKSHAFFCIMPQTQFLSTDWIGFDWIRCECECECEFVCVFVWTVNCANCIFIVHCGGFLFHVAGGESVCICWRDAIDGRSLVEAFHHAIFAAVIISLSSFVLSVSFLFFFSSFIHFLRHLVCSFFSAPHGGAVFTVWIYFHFITVRFFFGFFFGFTQNFIQRIDQILAVRLQQKLRSNMYIR